MGKGGEVKAINKDFEIAKKKNITGNRSRNQCFFKQVIFLSFVSTHSWSALNISFSIPATVLPTPRTHPWSYLGEAAKMSNSIGWAPP